VGSGPPQIRRHYAHSLLARAHAKRNAAACDAKTSGKISRCARISIPPASFSDCGCRVQLSRRRLARSVAALWLISQRGIGHTCSAMSYDTNPTRTRHLRELPFSYVLSIFATQVFANSESTKRQYDSSEPSHASVTSSSDIMTRTPGQSPVCPSGSRSTQELPRFSCVHRGKFSPWGVPARHAPGQYPDLARKLERLASTARDLRIDSDTLVLDD